VSGLLRVLGTAFVAGIVAASVAAGRPDDRAVVLDLYLLFLGALALGMLVHATVRAQPPAGSSPFEAALRGGRRVREPTPEEFERLEAAVLLAKETASDLHFRLRPILVEIARERLFSRQGVDLDASPSRARAILGATAWELLRPDREPPTDRLAPGASQAELRDVVDAVGKI
jgi:hypothetical protein